MSEINLATSKEQPANGGAEYSQHVRFLGRFVSALKEYMLHVSITLSNAMANNAKELLTLNLKIIRVKRMRMISETGRKNWFQVDKLRVDFICWIVSKCISMVVTIS